MRVAGSPTRASQIAMAFGPAESYSLTLRIPNVWLRPASQVEPIVSASGSRSEPEARAKGKSLPSLALRARINPLRLELLLIRVQVAGQIARPLGRDEACRRVRLGQGERDPQRGLARARVRRER